MLWYLSRALVSYWFAAGICGFHSIDHIWRCAYAYPHLHTDRFCAVHVLLFARTCLYMLMYIYIFFVAFSFLLVFLFTYSSLLLFRHSVGIFVFRLSSSIIELPPSIHCFSSVMGAKKAALSKAFADEFYIVTRLMMS